MKYLLAMLCMVSLLAGQTLYGQYVGAGLTDPLITPYADTTVGHDTLYTDTFRINTRVVDASKMTVQWSVDCRGATNATYLWVWFSNDPEFGWFDAVKIDSIENGAVDDTTFSTADFSALGYQYMQFWFDIDCTLDTIFLNEDMWFRWAK